MRHNHFKRLRPKDKKVLRNLFGRSAVMVGNSNEKHVRDTLIMAGAERKLPTWIICWRHERQNSAQDIKGADFTFITDVGDIYLQVKSSLFKADLFREKHPEDNFCVVVVDIRDSLITTYHKIMIALASSREKMQTSRAAP